MALVHIILTDDWELWGDGSGNMQRLQFDHMEKLINIYEDYGLQGSFNVEVMQQLYHLKLGRRHTHLAALARIWEDRVKRVYAKGHDIQLHLHPQWLGAVYENGRWRLKGSESILDYPPEDMFRMLSECKEYLEGLLQPLDHSYRCVSFRSGAWHIAPNNHILSQLAQLGFVCDTSVINGVGNSSRNRSVIDHFLPYYPNMKDARLISASPQPIVCVPTYAYKHNLATLLLREVARILNRWSGFKIGVFAAPNDFCSDQDYYKKKPVPAKRQFTNTKTFNKRLLRILKSTHYLKSDLSTSSFTDMWLMMRDILKQAKASGWPLVPVILANHTKDIGKFEPIERFCSFLQSLPDIEVITSHHLACNLQDGKYPVLTQ